jgi:eukaryotic translation initiation factor 2C
VQNSGSFDHFKRVVEQRYGYHSLCLAQVAIRKSKQPEQYMANVAMKVNIRLGNINHTFERPDGSSDSSIRKLFNSKKQLDTMILGADVTHTQKDSAAGSHSLAALVGSVDDTFGQFYGSMRYQKKDKEVSVMCEPKLMFLTTIDHR